MENESSADAPRIKMNVEADQAIEAIPIVGKDGAFSQCDDASGLLEPGPNGHH